VNLALLILLLALLWAGMTGTFSGANLLLGVAFAVVALGLLRLQLTRPLEFRRVGRTVALLILFVRELIVSAVRVAAVVVSPRLDQVVRPAIVAFPLTVKSDAEITLLANLITLTPGTLSVDVSKDRKLLYVHVLTLDTREALIADIAGGFERRILEVFA
jgi:multicomponent Na+:H+ antiporter subunit E